MRIPGRQSLVRSAAWGLVAGIITVAACFATLGGFAHLSGFQVGWITLAGIASTSYTGYSALAAAKSAATISQVSVAVADIDSRAKDKTIALLSKVVSMWSDNLVQLFSKPDQFDSVVDGPLEALRMALCQSHGVGESRMRVSFISFATSGDPRIGGSPPHPEISVRCAPANQMLRYDFASQDIKEQLHAVMSRRHPYHVGWLFDGLNGTATRAEYHVLAPPEREFTSYIRVGVPGLGVLCVDCSDPSQLVVADRELALAFADILAIPGRVGCPLGTQLPAVNPVNT